MNTQQASRSATINHILSPKAADKLAEAFEDGRNGFLGKTDNPHEPGTVIFHVWNFGHTAAELEADEIGAILTDSSTRH